MLALGNTTVEVIVEFSNRKILNCALEVLSCFI